jgi:NADH:ubiquinone oxidoreductase subunit 5 (subunit L)/multisubunit Na+/H+ antiporter MnhA subunit
MEGPTNVSALLHSATLVLAGLFVYSTSFHLHTDIGFLACLLFTGFIMICLSNVPDPDAKKISATSTCIIISLL